jgi:hypothetical protein
MAFCRLIAALSETDPGRKGSLLRRAETITAGRLMLPAGGSPMGLENERRALGVLHGAKTPFLEPLYSKNGHSLPRQARDRYGKC